MTCLKHSSWGRALLSLEQSSYEIIFIELGTIQKISLVEWRHFYFHQQIHVHVTRPHHIMSFCITSYHVVLHHIMSFCIISYHVVLHHIMSFCIISYHVVLHHIISCHFASHHIMSFCIISYVILHHIISCRFASYHIMSFCMTSYHVSDMFSNFHLV